MQCCSGCPKCLSRWRTGITGGRKSQKSVHAAYKLEARIRLDERSPAEATSVESNSRERHGLKLVGVEQPPTVCSDAVADIVVAVLELNHRDTPLSGKEGEQRIPAQLLHSLELVCLPARLEPLEALRLHPLDAFDAGLLLD